MDEWKRAVASLSGKRMEDLCARIDAMRRHHTVYPAPENVFNALEQCPFSRVRVVILGQDPYHGPGQAHGLAFSVPQGVMPPPSLKNIFKEIEQSGCRRDNTPPSTDLTRWARQGVLLLNTVLTVEARKAGSHRNMGWEEITDDIVRTMGEKKEGLVFLLWGSSARKKGALIDRGKHCVLEAPHPSPLSAYRGFFGCNHFALANDYLNKRRETPIMW